MTLGPRTLKAIADAPQLWSDGPEHYNGEEYESPHEFARRVALIAVEEERERAILEHDQSACAAEIADLGGRLGVAHAEGFADGARAQRDMHPTFQMNAAASQRNLDDDFYKVFCAMQRATPLASVSGEKK